MGLFDWFSKTPAQTDSIIRDKSGVFRCPYCNLDLKPIIDHEAGPVFDVFRRMGSLASSVTMDTARDQFIFEQGITCSCGVKLKPFKGKKK